jgi:hypothetical protein
MSPPDVLFLRVLAIPPFLWGTTKSVSGVKGAIVSPRNFIVIGKLREAQFDIVSTQEDNGQGRVYSGTVSTADDWASNADSSYN